MIIDNFILKIKIFKFDEFIKYLLVVAWNLSCRLMPVVCRPSRWHNDIIDLNRIFNLTAHLKCLINWKLLTPIWVLIYYIKHWHERRLSKDSHSLASTAPTPATQLTWIADIYSCLRTAVSAVTKLFMYFRTDRVERGALFDIVQLALKLCCRMIRTELALLHHKVTD